MNFQAHTMLLLMALLGGQPSEEGQQPVLPEQIQQATASMFETRFARLYDRPPKFARPAAVDYPEISGQRLFEYLSALTDFSQRSRAGGDVVWGRIQGSQAERDATRYVASKFREWQLEEVRIDTFPLTGGSWRPDEVSLEALADDGSSRRTIRSAATTFPSGQTPDGGLVAPIEYVGLGTPADLRDRDLSGKIALVYVRTFSGVLMHSGLAAAARIASTTEAAGLLLWIDLPGNGKYAAQLFSEEGWIDSLPWMNIGFHDGFYLRQLIEQSPPGSPPHVRMTVQGELHMEGTSQNLVGIVRGTTDENLIVTAHIDGFWNAILDNGTGVASLMELARYYASVPTERRERNLIFLVTGDHELEGAGGSAVFQAAYPELIENSVLALQLEHLVAPNLGNFLNTLQLASGSSPMSLFVSNGNRAVMDQFRSTIERYGLVVSNNVQLNTAGDVDGLSQIPSAGLIQTGFLYHNDMDTLDWYEPDELAHVTRAHAFLIDALDKLPRDAFGKQDAANTLPPIYAADELRTLLAPW